MENVKLSRVCVCVCVCVYLVYVYFNPLQCSCLENPRDGGAWWAAVYGVAQSWARLKQLSNKQQHRLPLEREGNSSLP